jgi:membrane protease YdiL (CAAX protease family)
LREAATFLWIIFPLTWLFWFPGAYMTPRGASGVANFLIVVGSFAPLAVAFYLNRLADRPTFDLPRWLATLSSKRLIAALVLPFVLLLPIVMYRLYQDTLDLSFLFYGLEELLMPSLIAIALAFGEEVGWRGFLLPRLANINLALTNVVIGVLWFVWQIPFLLTRRISTFSTDTQTHLTTFLLFSILITPFLNRLALRSGFNVILPAILRGLLVSVFAFYATKPPLDDLTHPYGLGVLAWLAVLNGLLFAQLWLGRRGDETELERVMPLEPAIK